MKKVLLTIACLLTSLAMVQAVQLNWFWKADSGAPSFGPGAQGSVASIGANWIIQLVEYDGGYASGIGGAGNVLDSGVLNGPPTLKQYTGDKDVANSGTVYIRLYNATSVGAATHYVNLGVNGGAGFHTMAASGADPEFFTGDLGIDNSTTTDTSARGTWVVIPEPGTIILFGLGALVIAARKKFRK